MGVPKTSDLIQNKVQLPNPSQEHPESSNTANQELKDHIQIKIKMPSPSQEPQASSKAPNEDLKDMNVLCTFKIKIEPKFRIWVDQRPLTISK